MTLAYNEGVEIRWEQVDADYIATRSQRLPEATCAGTNRRTTMTERDKRLQARRADARHSEQQTLEHPDEALDLSRSRVARPNRSKPFTVRLSPEEFEELTREADSRHLPASTLARAWLLDRLHANRPA